MVYRFSLPFASISKKNSRPIYVNRGTGKPFLGKSKKLIDFEKDALFILNAQKNHQAIRSPIETPCDLKAVFWFKDRRGRDADNQLNTVKDCLQAAGIIKNDKLFTTGSWDMRFAMPEDKVEMVITVKTEDGQWQD